MLDYQLNFPGCGSGGLAIFGATHLNWASAICVDRGHFCQNRFLAEFVFLLVHVFKFFYVSMTFFKFIHFLEI